MSQLYCGTCQNYLMGSDGECHDCSCGWKQPIESSDESSDESSEIEALKADVLRLQSECDRLRAEFVKTSALSAYRLMALKSIEKGRLE